MLESTTEVCPFDKQTKSAYKAWKMHAWVRLLIFNDGM